MHAFGSPCRLWLLAGFSIRLTIPVETSKSAVTAVPTNAVSLAADVTSRVLVDRGGEQEYVTVQPGLSTGGYVEVKTPMGDSPPANSWWATKQLSHRQ